MKKAALLTFFILLAMVYSASAQNDAQPQNKTENTSGKKNKLHKHIDPTMCRKAYIGFSMGINNPSGIVGFDADIPVTKNVSVGAGFGGSTWGHKIYVDARYYLKPCHRGWALGIGITHNTANTNYKTNLETIYGKEDVILDLHAQSNIFIGVYHFWTLGSKYNRIYVLAGYSEPFSTYHYTERQGDPLDNKGKSIVKSWSPGGLMVGLGFSFGLH